MIDTNTNRINIIHDENFGVRTKGVVQQNQTKNGNTMKVNKRVSAPLLNIQNNLDFQQANKNNNGNNFGGMNFAQHQILINNFNNPNSCQEVTSNNYINNNSSNGFNHVAHNNFPDNNNKLSCNNNIDSITPQISTKESFNSLNGLQTNPPIPNIKEDLNLNLMEEEALSNENNKSNSSLGGLMIMNKNSSDNGHNINNSLNANGGNTYALNGGFNNFNNHFNGAAFGNNNASLNRENGMNGNSGVNFNNNSNFGNSFFNNNSNNMNGSNNNKINGNINNLSKGTRQNNTLSMKMSEEEPKFQPIQQQQMENEIYSDLKKESNIMDGSSNYINNIEKIPNMQRFPSNNDSSSCIDYNLNLNNNEDINYINSNTNQLVNEIREQTSYEGIELNEENLKKITNLHNRLIDEILLQEDELIKQHEISIDQDVQNIKREMESVEEVKREASSLTDYLDSMNTI